MPSQRLFLLDWGERCFKDNALLIVLMEVGSNNTLCLSSPNVNIKKYRAPGHVPESPSLCHRKVQEGQISLVPLPLDQKNQCDISEKALEIIGCRL